MPIIWYSLIKSHPAREELELFPRQTSGLGGDTRMKIEKLFTHHVLTGIVLGALVGLYFPLDAYKPLIVILAVIMGLKVVATK